MSLSEGMERRKWGENFRTRASNSSLVRFSSRLRIPSKMASHSPGVKTSLFERSSFSSRSVKRTIVMRNLLLEKGRGISDV
ncbi:MAG: hypothetical protein S4CHLAM102_11730 [Chlamydiia bacterium]|nr:hypothetical protein [Chlamydiia bacterium]